MISCEEGGELVEFWVLEVWGFGFCGHSGCCY